MRLTVKEMEVLCVFHAGTLSETLEKLRFAAESNEQKTRAADMQSLLAKLSKLENGDVVYLSFDR